MSAELREIQALPRNEFRWDELALCKEVGTELFFAETKGEHGLAAKRVCMGCEVRVECLDAAMREERGFRKALRFGVRGGYAPNQRARMALAQGELQSVRIAGVA